MKIVFIDTSYLLALELKSDQFHEDARKHWQNLIKSNFSLVTTSYIFDETVTFLNSRGHRAKAVQLGEKLLVSLSVEMIHVNENLFYEGWNFFRQQKDKRYSLTDCISFIVMKEKNLETVLTFDKHFIQAGFKTQS
ncbi:MAG: type II toxin-antitoxin system VapC family toxin [Acidobacteriota bacterium]|nr:type II toxin-antitoxin system VapC family toxin [Acidobacteriota bacterium]